MDCMGWLLGCLMLEGASLVTILADCWFSVLLDSWGAAADTHQKPDFANFCSDRLCDRPIMLHNQVVIDSHNIRGQRCTTREYTITSSWAESASYYCRSHTDR